MKFFVRSVGILAAVAVLASCGGGGGASSTTAPGGGGGGGGNNSGCTTGDFCLGSSSFSPTTLTISRGATVTWVNNTGIQHDVTFDTPGTVTGGNVAAFSSGSVTRSFPTSGTFHFICSIHGPTMTATITVQ